MNTNKYDIIIVGSGVVGLTAALSLAKQTSLTIAIIEAKAVNANWDGAQYDYRVSAISLASQRIFKKLQVWDAITAKRFSPYTTMHVWNATDTSEIYFNCKEVNQPALGFIIEESVMRVSLLDEIKQCGNVEILSPYTLKSIAVMPAVSQVQIECENQTTLTAKLLIAADGANSSVRELLDIPLKTWDYQHTAIVATLQTELPHNNTARQRFLETGPLAFLPLENSHCSSIVWSTSHAHAAELMALNDEAFCTAVTEAFQKKLGIVNETSKRYHFPLRMRHAKRYVQSQVALIGDAAHTIHPLAGQGVNLGLLDAACLAEVIIEAVKKKRDFSALLVLRRYERSRKSDNFVMLAGVELLKKIFATQNTTLQQIRNAGMNFTNRTSMVKNFFIRYALGDKNNLPSLAK